MLWNRKLKVRHREAKPPALSDVSYRARVPTPVSSPPSCTTDVGLSLTAVVLHLAPALKQMHGSYQYVWFRNGSVDLKLLVSNTEFAETLEAKKKGGGGHFSFLFKNFFLHKK